MPVTRVVLSRPPLSRVVAAVAAICVVATSVAGCSPAPKTGGDFCSVYASAKTQLDAASTWVDAKGNVNVVKAATGLIQLVGTVQQLNAVAPPAAQANLDVIMSAYNGLKDALASGDQKRIQAAAAKLAGPAVQKALTNLADEAAKACS